MLPIFKKIILAFLIIFVSLLFLELAAKLSVRTFLKDTVSDQNLKTEFEEIFVPPFEEKRPGEFRVFVYGGSTVQGVPLPKIGFVNQLQYQLHKVFDYKDVKVFNLGWAGSNSTRIRYLISQTISQKPDLVIIYTGENEFIYPQLDFYFLVRSATFVKNRSDLGKILLYLTKADQSQHGQASTEKFPAYAANKLYVSLKMQIFKNNLKAIVSTTKKHQVPLILAIPGHNIADWPPVRREMTTQETPGIYQEGFQNVQKLISQKNFSAAESLVDFLLSRFPNDASLLFLKATILKVKGQPSLVIFEKAKDFDLVPWRTTTAYTNFIKSQEGQNVWVIDFVQVFRKNSKDQVPGFNFFLDGTHPNKEGAYLIAKTFSDFIISEKLIYPEWLKDVKDPYSVEELFKKMKIEKEDDFATYVSTASLALKIPLMNFDGAQYFIEKAEQINDKNWQTKAMKASLAHLRGNDQQARVSLGEAQTLKGSKISPQEAQSIPYLSEILEYQP